MSTLVKTVLGAMGRLRPSPALGDSPGTLSLPSPSRACAATLVQALEARASRREFRPDPLPSQLLSDLLWAADGTNRGGAGHTAPSAMHADEIEIFVALPQGAYRYDRAHHTLVLVAGADIRRVTGYQDFVDDAPLDLVYVADHARMPMIPVAHRSAFAHVAAGAVGQNVYLFCAGSGLSTVLRAWIDRDAIAEALGLRHDEQVLLSQTVGWPAT